MSLRIEVDGSEVRIEGSVVSRHAAEYLARQADRELAFTRARVDRRFRFWSQRRTSVGPVLSPSAIRVFWWRFAHTLVVDSPSGWRQYAEHPAR